MVAIPPYGRHEMIGVVVPKVRIAEPVGGRIAPHRGFLHHENAKLIGDVVPRLFPGLRVEPDRDVVPILNVLNNLSIFTKQTKTKGQQA